MRERLRFLVAVGAALSAVGPLLGQDFGAPPTPMMAIKRACDAPPGPAGPPRQPAGWGHDAWRHPRRL